MGQFDHQPEDHNAPPEYQATGNALRLLRADLESLRQKVSKQLAQDVEYLESRKQRLMGDIEALEQDFEDLKRQHHQLQHDHSQTLTQQQQAQQQLWAKRLAQALATHLHSRLQESLPTPGTNANGNSAALAATQQQVAALDVTLHRTLQSLQQDLTSYGSGLSQQISRMQSIEQQGEAILEALVTRLSQQLQTQIVHPARGLNGGGMGQAAAQGALPRDGYPRGAVANGHGAVQLPPAMTAPHSIGDVLREFNSPSPEQGQPATAVSQTDRVPPPAAPPPHSLGAYRSPPTSVPASAKSGVRQNRVGQNGVGVLGSPPPDASGLSPEPQSQPSPPSGSNSLAAQTLYTGLGFMVLSTLALSMHNVLVGLIGYGGQLLGRVPVESIFPLNFPNSLLLLWLRMVVVLPLLMAAAAKLYPPVWADMGQLFRDPDQRPVYQVVASGSFLFLSQVLIYKAIADVGPGVAVTLLFMYPLITVPLAWFLFGDRPTPLRLVVMFAISMGIVFTALPRIYTDLNIGAVSLWGVGAAILSSAAFALFLIAMQLSFRRLHPVPVSLMQFSTIFILTSLILIVGSLVGFKPGPPSSIMGLYFSGFLLGLLTLMGYLFNNYGVKLMGAAQASIVASSGPVMTAILAYVVTPGEKSALSFIQWMGVVLVTLGVISLSLERLNYQRRAAGRRPPALPNHAVTADPNSTQGP
jgi:drug/metabolite transporter (DMT)-like permease/uncharacterized protein YoxC